ncbi:hypothetical protein KY386_02570 [Candidatus Parcubacteria bacterium]|nr:hypothetical protein [Candidatus Parcubacteria bacterium]
MKARLYANIVAREFFQTALVTYLLLTLAETLREGFVSNFFNMNYLLLVVLVTGVVMVLTEPDGSPVGQAVRQAGSGAVAAARRAVPPAVRRRIGGIPAARNVLDLRQPERPPAPPRNALNLKSRPAPPPAAAPQPQPPVEPVGRTKKSRQLG